MTVPVRVIRGSEIDDGLLLAGLSLRSATIFGATRGTATSGFAGNAVGRAPDLIVWTRRADVGGERQGRRAPAGSAPASFGESLYPKCCGTKSRLDPRLFLAANSVLFGHNSLEISVSVLFWLCSQRREKGAGDPASGQISCHSCNREQLSCSE